MIVGTAGHVDHGKTALVKALTGVDTDRLEEEKRRGITIDLGFAPLSLGGRTLGVVDVPGHEAFVRNMLAGATGVDLALLVVAADEGVMPQTREHLAILSLLGVRGGVIALTKADLVADDWLELVRDDVRATVAGTPLADAPLVATSVVTGNGLDALRGAIAAAARALPLRDAGDLFRLPVDRAFTVRGTGTVVTGTVWSGALERDAIVRILPGSRTARVRAIESHGASIDRALPGMRAAVALAGVELGDVPRGTVLVDSDAWSATGAVLADVALLGTAPAIVGPRTAVRFHLGTADVGARVVTRGGPLAAGERKGARIVFDHPVVARAGDRFVLRGGSPLETIGGGVVEDPAPPHRRSRPWTSGASTPAERLPRLVDAAGAAGLPTASLAVRLGARPAEVGVLLAAANAPRVLGDRVYDARVLADSARRLEEAVNAYHASAPLEPGAPLGFIRAQLPADTRVVEEAIRERVASGSIVIHGSLVSRADWRVRLTPAQARSREAIRDALVSADREPPAVGELVSKHGSDTLSLLRQLERDGEVVQVEEERFYASEAVRAMVAELRKRMDLGAEYGPSELRDVLGGTRKFVIPFLEFCDKIGVTERRANGRVLGSTDADRLPRPSAR